VSATSNPLSRRAFVRALGWGAAAAAPRLVTARGSEALAARAISAGSAAADPSAAIQLDSNENPNGPGVEALDAVRAALSLANRYPYTEAGTLRTAIARLHGIPVSHVVLGCGSTEVIRMAMQTFVSRARPLVTASPTFEMPNDYAATLGAPILAVRVGGDLALALDAMEARTESAGLVYVCNPNNPTATVLPEPALIGFVDRLARTTPQTAVLIDEAYHEYVDDPAYATSIPLAVTHRNVIVSRTFSKIHGLAGLRCGYAIAEPDTITRLTRFKLETGVNQVAIAAGLAAIADAERVTHERALNRESKAYTRQLLASCGFPSGASETNFVFVDLKGNARAFRDGCRRAGVLVGRPFPPLDSYARISIGTLEEMHRAGAVFKRVLGA
jgi:histidinol-phosphate aminotransferase